jgi:DNA-binding NarL/FixJ family response regulator
MKALRIQIVDDHRLFREGLKMLLLDLPYVKGVDESKDGETFLTTLAAPLPDIVFMDIEMPGLGGVETTRQATQQFPGLRIIALSMYGDDDYHYRMIEAGARGFLLKNSEIQEVEAAIQEVMQGNTHFSAAILAGLIRNLSRKKEKRSQEVLTDRETEILLHICKGLSNQEIADTLFVSKRTVDKHRENILLKTGSRNTAGLVMYAIRNGIVNV